MEPLDLQAERFTATGNIASEGMRNQLGRPRLDRLAVLVREAAQNSWDAKRENADVVTFGVSCYELSSSQLRTLREDVFAELPDNPTSALENVLDEGKLRVLAIYDRGTTGLGGPTRADAPTDPDEIRDFVDFLRNVGQPPDKSRGGGTFGYGKAALYLSSAIDTILVHTRCQHAGRLESRFIVSGLTDHYEVDGKGYTGRHWWGRKGRGGIVDPITGAEANRLAKRLGMPLPKGDDRGTTILLLAPRFDGRTPTQAINYIQAQMLWNFWPKMVAWEDEDEPRMHFETHLDSEELDLPHPTNYPPLSGFVESLRAVRRADSQRNVKNVDTLWCQRPKKKLGLLSLRKAVRKPRLDIDYGEDTEPPEFVDRCHHVALLRRAELVVRYHPGPRYPNDYVEYAGVFLADDDMDRIYAASEPPTHDEWRPENLADARARTFVRVTLRRIDAMTADEVAPKSTAHGAEEDRPLAALASHLGGLLVDAGGAPTPLQWSAPTSPSAAAASGDGGNERDESGGEASSAPEPPAPPPPRRRRATPRIQLGADTRLVADQGVLARLFQVQVTHTKSIRRTRLRARANVILAGGAEERDAPAGADSPRIASWRGPSGVRFDSLDSVIVDEHEEGAWEVRVEGATDSLVALEVTGEAVDDEGC